ncbi:MAG: DUF4253 domain-containing protein [Corynebacterium sp.]|nr:DUF4253 domain-containing protein [Corynebacterium sp.]
MDFQPWPKQIKPYCPNPHSLDELKQLLTDWGYKYEVLTTFTDEPQEVGVQLHNQPKLTELWGHLLATFPELGFWPLYSKGFDRELDAPCVQDIGTASRFYAYNTLPWFENIIEQGWNNPTFPELTDERLESFADFHTFNALTANSFNSEVLDMVDDDGNFKGSLLIVPTTRPADAPAAVGWMGAINFGYTGATISTVLRSWEERFGAILIRLDSDQVLLWPWEFRPLTDNQLINLTLEHYIFCPDNIDQSSETFPEYGNTLQNKMWLFWWD